MTERAEREEQLVELLMEEKKRLWSDVRSDLFDQIGDQLHSQYDLPQDIGDRGMIDVLQDTGLAVAEIKREQLTRIDEALARLEQGRFGYCEDCDEEIPLERLKVAPYAPCCVPCQENREAHGSPSGGTL